MNEFSFLESFIQKRKRLILMVFLFLVIGVIVITLFIEGRKLIDVLFLLGIVFSITVLTFIVFGYLIFGNLRKTKVLIYEDKLVKQCHKAKQVVLYDNISRIKIIENTKGGINAITIYQKNEEPVCLFGFSEMEKIVNLIKGKISENVLVQTKRYKIDWEHPGIYVGAVICVMIIMIFIASRGRITRDIFGYFVNLCLGSWFLLFRPISKVNIRFKWFEIILGILLIIANIYRLIYIIS